MSGGGTTSPARAGAGLLGVGAAACVACCAGPVLGALSAIGIASAAGYLLAGSAALVVGVVAAAGVVYRRRVRQRTECSTRPASPVAFLADPSVTIPASTPPRPADQPDDGDEPSGRPMVTDAG